MKKITLLCVAVLCCLNIYGQVTLTPSKTEIISGETIIVTASGEVSTKSIRILDDAPLESVSIAPGPNFANYIPYSSSGLILYSTTSGTKFNVKINNTLASTSITIKLAVRVRYFNASTGQIGTESSLLYFQVKVNPKPASFPNVAKSKTFYKNDCPTGYQAKAYIYTVPANRYTSTTQIGADALAQADIDANGQNEANAYGECQKIYYNVAISTSFIRNNCPIYSTTGPAVPYAVPAAQFSSLISQTDADTQAQTYAAINGQANANAVGTCTIKNTLTIRYTNEAYYPGKVTRLQVKNSSGTVLYDFNNTQLQAGQEIPRNSSYTFVVTTTGTLSEWKSIEMRVHGATYTAFHSDNTGTVYTYANVDTTNSYYFQLFLFALYS